MLLDAQLLQNFDPNRKPFSAAEAGMLAMYVLEYNGEKQAALELLLTCCYDQGVRDAVEGIITLDEIDARNTDELLQQVAESMQ